MNTDIIMNNTTTGNNVAVKVTRGEEMRRFQFNGKSFQEIKAIMSQLFTIPVEDFTLQYQDDEKDRVTLSSDTELNEAIKLHQNVLRFYVVTKPASAVQPATNPSFIPLDLSPVQDARAQVTDGEVASPASPAHHHPYYGHGHRRGGHHGYGHRRGGHHGHDHPHHGPHHDHPHHGPHHDHHHNKRHFDKEEREAWKLEKKRFKKQRKCEKESSSSSSSSEEDVQKVQRKEMKQVMKATKHQIKMNWLATKEANPAQWPQNKKLMIAEIKSAKKLILQQAANPNVVVPVVEQNVATVTNVVTEMQA